MRVALPFLAAASLATASVIPYAHGAAAAPQAPAASAARTGADIDGEALFGGHLLWIGIGIVALIILLIVLLDGDDGDTPVSP